MEPLAPALVLLLIMLATSRRLRRSLRRIQPRRRR